MMLYLLLDMNTFPLVSQYTLDVNLLSINFSFSIFFFSFASLLKAEYEFISSGLYLVVLLHLCEQSFSDMMGNTNEPSTRVRVSNLGAGEKGGCDATSVCFGKQIVLYVHSLFPLGSSYIKIFLKIKGTVDLIEIAVCLTSLSSSLIFS